MESDPAPHLPIAQLNPSVDSGASVRGIVTLVWPYSSSRRTTSILLVEPDFRLRQKKGQIRVTFTGSSALAVARSGLTSGDELRIYLDGAAWHENSLSAGTPGRAVDWELVYRRRLRLERIDGGEDQTIINVNRTGSSPELDSTSLSPPQTPVTALLPDSRTQLRGLNETGVWASPAFLKRISLPLTSTYTEVDLENELSWLEGRPSKRTKFGRDSGQWRFADRTPSPSKGVDVQDFMNDDEFELAPEQTHVVPSKKVVSGVSGDGYIVQDEASNDLEAEVPASVSLPAINENQQSFLIVGNNKHTLPQHSLDRTASDDEAQRLLVQSSEPISVPGEHVYLEVGGQPGAYSSEVLENHSIVIDPGAQIRYEGEPRTPVSERSDTTTLSSPEGTDLERLLDGNQVTEEPSLNDQSSYFSEQSFSLSPTNQDLVSTAGVSLPNDSRVSTKSVTSDQYPEDDKMRTNDNFTLHMTASGHVEGSDDLSTTENEDEIYERPMEPRDYVLATDHSESIEVIELSSSDEDGSGSEVSNGPDAAEDSDKEPKELFIKHQLYREAENEHIDRQKVDHVQEPDHMEPHHRRNTSRDIEAEQDIESPSKPSKVLENPPTAGNITSEPIRQTLIGDDGFVLGLERGAEHVSLDLTSSDAHTRTPSGTDTKHLPSRMSGRRIEEQLPHPPKAADAPERHIPLTPQLSGLQEPTSPSSSHQLKTREIPVMPDSNPSSTTATQQLITPVSTQPVAYKTTETNMSAKKLSPTSENLNDTNLGKEIHLALKRFDTQWPDEKEPDKALLKEVDEEYPLGKTGRPVSAHQVDEESLKVRSEKHEGESSTQSVAQHHIITAIDPIEKHVKLSSDRLDTSPSGGTQGRNIHLQSPSKKWTSNEIKLQSFDGSSDDGVHSDMKGTELDHSNGFRTALSYFTSLVSLDEYFGSIIDVMAIVLSSTKPARAKHGPRDMVQTLHLLDRSTSAKPSFSTAAQIYRPSQAALPRVQSGDVILLRDFKVQSQKRKMILVSTDSSGWAVFHRHEAVQMRGPPVEFGVDEEKFAQSLLDWWANREEGTRTRAASKAKQHEELMIQQNTPGILNNKHTLRDGTTYTGEQSQGDHKLRDGTAYRDG